MQTLFARMQGPLLLSPTVLMATPWLCVRDSSNGALKGDFFPLGRKKRLCGTAVGQPGKVTP